MSPQERFLSEKCAIRYCVCVCDMIYKSHVCAATASHVCASCVCVRACVCVLGGRGSESDSVQVKFLLKSFKPFQSYRIEVKTLN